jgi:hypothetical protein
VAAIEGLLCREYAPVWHTIAPPVPLNLIHQDTFDLAWKNYEIAGLHATKREPENRAHAPDPDASHR